MSCNGTQNEKRSNAVIETGLLSRWLILASASIGGLLLSGGIFTAVRVLASHPSSTMVLNVMTSAFRLLGLSLILVAAGALLGLFFNSPISRRFIWLFIPTIAYIVSSGLFFILVFLTGRYPLASTLIPLIGVVVGAAISIAMFRRIAGFAARSSQAARVGAIFGVLASVAIAGVVGLFAKSHDATLVGALGVQSAVVLAIMASSVGAVLAAEYREPIGFEVISPEEGSAKDALSAHPQVSSPIRVRKPQPNGWIAFVVMGVVFLLGFVIAITPRDRSNGLRQIVLSAQHVYARTEGSNHRGKAFSQLTEQIQFNLVMEGQSVKEKEILGYLGPPDYVLGAMKRPKQFAYLYDRFAKKDWVVIVNFNAQGLVTNLAWSPTSAQNFRGWRKNLSVSTTTGPTRKQSTRPAKAPGRAI